MAKKDKPEVQKQEEQKVQTKYDRKVEERKIRKEQEKKQEKVYKITASVIGIVLVAAIALWVGISVYNRQTALNSTYVKVGDHELTKVEYDYYYRSTVNSYLTNYASILPYMGLDTSVDYAEQEYMDGMTWKDMFDEMTVAQIQQMKALSDDAQKTGFTYENTDTEYQGFAEGMETAAETTGVSVGQYYKSVYGDYASVKTIESFIRENIVAEAYYSKLLEDNAPTDEEIESYYLENQQNYDKVDYRSFTFTADLAEDATEEDITAAMADLKKNADAMLADLEGGKDFEELCATYAAEDQKANYEDAETDYSLTEGGVYMSMASVMGDWLYDDTRAEGDIAVLEDEASNRYYVVAFISRYYDEADDANISSSLASQRVVEYMNALIENYDVTDVKGELKYLTIDTDAATTEAEDTTETDAAEETEEATEAEEATETEDTAETE